MMTPTLTQSKERRAAITPENFQFLCDAVYEDSGIVLDTSKHYLVEARLTPIVRSEGVETLDSLCNLIRAASGAKLREKVVEAMTTNETLFFRDLKPFDAMRQAIIPEIVESGRVSRTIRVWSAACSTGQEAYSLAMLWSEMKIGGWNLKITGTDLSDEVLEKAREGKFSQLEVNRGLPAVYLVKYFTRQEKDWIIKPELRAMTEWQKFNLKAARWNYGPFDVVFCRNVLIYFDTETKTKILNKIYESLSPGGYLILGASETTLNLDTPFVRKHVGPSVAYQKTSDR